MLIKLRFLTIDTYGSVKNDEQIRDTRSGHTKGKGSAVKLCLLKCLSNQKIYSTPPTTQSTPMPRQIFSLTAV